MRGLVRGDERRLGHATDRMNVISIRECLGGVVVGHEV
jgi:hypothetical protein